MIMRKSAEFNIELNVKDEKGQTAFHLACASGKKFNNFSTVKIMLANAHSSNLDLLARNNNVQTGFQLAQQFGVSYVVDYIKTKMPSIAK